MQELLRRVRKSPEDVQPPVKPRPQIPEQYENLDEHADIPPSEDAPQLIEEINELLADNEGLSEEQFVAFADKMIGIVGGYHHALNGGRERTVRAELGRKPGNAIEIFRDMGDSSGPDVRISKYKQINEDLESSHLLMLDETTTVFSYDPEVPSSITRTVYDPFPSLSPEITSTTGETLKPMRRIEIDGKNNLSPKELHAIATDTLDFYASTVDTPPEMDR